MRLCTLSLSIALVTNPVTRSPFSEEQSAAISNRSRSSRHMASLTGFGKGGVVLLMGISVQVSSNLTALFLSFVVIGLTFCRDATSHLFPNSLRWLLALHYRVGRPLVPKVLFTLFFPRLLALDDSCLWPSFRKSLKRVRSQESWLLTGIIPNILAKTHQIRHLRRVVDADLRFSRFPPRNGSGTMKWR